MTAQDEATRHKSTRDGATRDVAIERATDPSSRGPSSDDPRRRGQLQVAAKVVEKIASYAASEIAAAGGRSGGLFGLGGHADLTAKPEVDVTLLGTSAELAIAVAVGYPGSIRQATETVRQRVVDRVEHLTGLTVGRVDIDVTALPPATTRRSGGLR